MDRRFCQGSMQHLRILSTVKMSLLGALPIIVVCGNRSARKDKFTYIDTQCILISLCVFDNAQH